MGILSPYLAQNSLARSEGRECFILLHPRIRRRLSPCTSIYRVRQTGSVVLGTTTPVTSGSMRALGRATYSTNVFPVTMAAAMANL
jgi:hypothetical protein